MGILFVDPDVFLGTALEQRYLNAFQYHELYLVPVFTGAQESELLRTLCDALPRTCRKTGDGEPVFFERLMNSLYFNDERTMANAVTKEKKEKVAESTRTGTSSIARNVLNPRIISRTKTSTVNPGAAEVKVTTVRAVEAETLDLVGTKAAVDFEPLDTSAAFEKLKKARASEPAPRVILVDGSQPYAVGDAPIKALRKILDDDSKKSAPLFVIDANAPYAAESWKRFIEDMQKTHRVSRVMPDLLSEPAVYAVRKNGEIEDYQGNAKKEIANSKELTPKNVDKLLAGLKPGQKVLLGIAQDPRDGAFIEAMNAATGNGKNLAMVVAWSPDKPEVDAMLLGRFNQTFEINDQYRIVEVVRDIKTKELKINFLEQDLKPEERTVEKNLSSLQIAMLQPFASRGYDGYFEVFRSDSELEKRLKAFEADAQKGGKVEWPVLIEGDNDKATMRLAQDSALELRDREMANPVWVVDKNSHPSMSGYGYEDGKRTRNPYDLDGCTTVKTDTEWSSIVHGNKQTLVMVIDEVDPKYREKSLAMRQDLVRTHIKATSDDENIELSYSELQPDKQREKRDAKIESLVCIPKDALWRNTFEAGTKTIANYAAKADLFPFLFLLKGRGGTRSLVNIGGRHPDENENNEVVMSYGDEPMVHERGENPFKGKLKVTTPAAERRVMKADDVTPKSEHLKIKTAISRNIEGTLNRDPVFRTEFNRQLEREKTGGGIPTIHVRFI
ncbi:MAG: hypothetical protein HY540_06945, partial [Deltaproteobacteria bacterium]|nr:hypothetical protein [Deltaproteobacteria bacterium]